ncbi:MAG: DUF4159 domain-containing protein [Lentisphaeraceae bacterium]|nr:DUF4159 domain-containing protein [Lentisphaeraceae bacterium]
MKFKLLFFCILLSLFTFAQDKPAEQPKKEESSLPAVDKGGAPSVRIGQVVSVNPMSRSYPNALRSLLDFTDQETTIKVDKDPRIFRSFEDEAIFDCPFIYVNYVDREEWNFTKKEIKNIKRYLENGGFIYIDAGINSEFLRKDKRAGQHHSFADWSVTPDLDKAFKDVFAGKKFKSLPRSHKLYKVFYKGLPDPSVLPDTVRTFVVNEKWPQGTYSAVGLEVNGRIAVLCTPIIAMGWGKRYNGEWETQISFRIRESTDGLGEYLQNAASYSSYQANREDGGKDVVYTDATGRPAWVKEPDGTYRIFRYVSTQTISNYAHEFYSRLGINIIIYALTH